MNKTKDTHETQTTIWEKCLLYIKDRVPDLAFQTWFVGIKLSTVTEDEVVLQVPNKFHYEWLESKYRILIDDAIKNNFNHPRVVNYSVVISEKKPESIPTISSSNVPVPKVFDNRSKLNNKYTFNNYIEGKGNQLAKAAAFSVAENSGTTPFNPLLIYSKTGLGKTHLIQAIGNYITRKFPNSRTVYLTSEKFMHDFISSIQENRTTSFAKSYRKSDLLLIDDIQFFQKKEQTQEQFFHLFNDLYQKGKQIVLTTDRHPSQFTGIKERLVSRFKSGLIVDIQSPDLETRIAILMKKAQNDGLEIPFEITEYIATCVKGTVRDLEAALRRMMAFSTLKQQDITMALAKQVVVDIIGTSAFSEVNIDHVLKCVSTTMGVPEKLIIGKGRKKDVALARQVAMFLSRELTGSSLFNIGTHLGRRDHSTVIHACKTVENKMKEDKNFKLRINKMKKEIGGIGSLP